MSMLAEFLMLPRQGVLIVLDEMDRRSWVSYTTNTGLTLSRLYDQLGGRATNLDLKVVSAGADIETLKLHTEMYKDYYKLNGYSPILPYGRKVLEYRVRAVPGEGLKSADVELVTVRGVSKVVGKFKTMGEAKSYIETCYGEGNPYCLPVYALNADTEAFVRDRETKLLDVR